MTPKRKIKKLEAYAFCKGSDCKTNNTILVINVFSDLNYIPLCNKCAVKHRKIIKGLAENSICLTYNDVLDVYFNICK